MQIKQAMILAAGYGKRLHPLTLTIPKPLVQVHSKPLLAHILEDLQALGIQKIVINTHYLAAQIHDFLQDRPIIVSHEEILLDTGGGIYKALAHFNDEPFWVVNGDCYWQGTLSTTIKKMQNCWDAERMDVLLALVSRPEDMLGDYFLEADGRITYRGSHEIAPYVYPGLAILHPRLLRHAAPGVFSLVPYFHEAQASGRLYGLLHQGAWWDVGTPQRFEALQRVG